VVVTEWIRFLFTKIFDIVCITYYVEGCSILGSDNLINFGLS
jgi:hypothetical protein